MKSLLYSLKNAFVITSTFCFYLLTSAQEKWPVNSEDLKFDGIELRETELLEQVHGIDCFEDNPLLKSLLQCGGNQLHSKDGSFIAFNRFGEAFYTNDSTSLTMIMDFGGRREIDPYVVPELSHLRRARDDIKRFIPENESDTWKQYIDYYPQDRTKALFNADTAISYSFRLEPKDYYKGKYKNIWILMRHRNNRTFISTYALYEDMSEEKLAKFKAAVENSFIYDDANKPIMHPKSLKAMKLQYFNQDMFISAYKTGSFDNYPTLKSILHYKSQLHSKDGRVIVLYSSHPDIFTQKKADDLKKRMPGRNFDLVDKQHVNQLRAEIKHILRNEAALDFKNYLVYATAEQAASKFNADTVITYNIRLKPEDSYKERYNNLWSLTIQKKGRGYITLHCLYEDMPDKELALYKAAVENLLRYDD